MSAACGFRARGATNLLGALILVLCVCASAPQALAQPVKVDECPVASRSPDQLLLHCGADDTLLVLTLPDLANGGYEGTLTQSEYTTTLVWLTLLGGLTHSPVWGYLTADGSSACQLDGRPPAPEIVRSCISLDAAGL